MELLRNAHFGFPLGCAAMSITEDELKRVLSSKDVPVATDKLQNFLLEIKNRKYLLSSLFYTSYTDMLSVIFGLDENRCCCSCCALRPS